MYHMLHCTNIIIIRMISYLVSSLITIILVTQQCPSYNLKKEIIVVNLSRGPARKALNGLLRALAEA